MTIRTRVDALRQRVRVSRDHQGLRLALADRLVPAAVRQRALGLLKASGDYQQRVDDESARLFPVLDAWSDRLARVQFPDETAPCLDAVDYHAPGWYLVRVPVPDAAVLDDARRAVRAAAMPAADQLEGDAVAASAYAGHLALLLALPMADLERQADELGV